MDPALLMSLIDMQKKRKEEDKAAFKKSMKQIGNTASDIGSVTGNALMTSANIPGEEPNIGRSILGGTLAGIGGGPLGMLAGAASGALTSVGSANAYENYRNLSNPDVLDKGVYPKAYMEEGGNTGYNSIQAEEGELMLFPEGDIVDVLADDKHKNMKSSKVTDMVPDGTYVFSNKLEVDTRKIKEEDDIIASYPGTYSEQGNTPMQYIKLTDVLGKGKMTFAEAVDKIRKKIPTMDDIKDITTTQTNDMNVESRNPYLMKLMEMQESKKSKKYKEGDVVDVTEVQLQDLINQGYQVENAS